MLGDMNELDDFKEITILIPVRNFIFSKKTFIK